LKLDFIIISPAIVAQIFAHPFVAQTLKAQPKKKQPMMQQSEKATIAVFKPPTSSPHFVWRNVMCLSQDERNTDNWGSQ
jgi:hypothetical protein